jgi:anaphase-promoting complex subunit 3
MACAWLVHPLLRTVSPDQRGARTFPEEAVLHCRSGLTALKGNLPEQARSSLLRALALNPMIWEGFEGLCSLGENARGSCSKHH